MDKESINKQTDVAFTILKQLASAKPNEKSKNLVFSPLSLYTVLSLLAAGSEGATRDQLLSFLKAKSVDQLNSLASHINCIVFAQGIARDAKNVSFANGAWFTDCLRLKPFFREVVDKYYKASVNLVDFCNKAEDVRKEVNTWVEEETKGLIKGLLQAGSVTEHTRFILANALYFKGAWVDEFDPSRMKEYDFFLLDGTSVRAPFMTFNYYVKPRVSVHDGYKVLRLPYEDEINLYKEELEGLCSFTMFVLLPDAWDGLTSLIDRICSDSGFLDQPQLPGKYAVKKFRVPKFKISMSFEAKDALQDLGLVSPFRGGDFSEMVEPPQGQHLQVSSIFQKVFIEVDEKGTEAAAATCGGLAGCCRNWEPPVEIDFVADHPFLFFIKEMTTGSVLFLGQVLNPMDRSKD